MKKVYLLILVSLILLLAFTACAKKHEHDFAEATCESPAKCSCGETQGEALGHDLTAATCTTPATCNRCGQTDGSALGHNWLDATCTAPKTCSTCKTTEGAPAGHKNDIVLSAVAPSCSATGLTEGVKCSACGTVTTEQEVVQKLPHTEEILAAVESTCSEAGLTEGKKCSVCDEVLVAQQPTDKKAHTEVTLPGKAATCEETGLTEGKQCSVCKEITVKQEIIPLVAHTEQTLGGYAATCTTPGKTDGKWCTVCETILVPQEDIPASHQNVVDKPGYPATCTDRGLTDGKYCEACSTWIVEQEPILDVAPGHDTADTGRITDQSPATCQADGYYEWTIGCWNCNYTETVRVTPDSDEDPAGVGLETLEQLDHVFTNYVYNNDATCFADGTKTAVCDLCKDFPEPVSDTVTAEGTQREHLEPTNVACGEHWECQYEDCDYVSPDALEHQMVEKTCTEYAYCERNNGCTYVDVAGGYADHTRGESVEENRVEAKCEVAGSYDEVYYCTVCKTHEIERITHTIDPLEHVWADPTCSEPSKCTLCDVAKDGSTPRASHKLVMSYDGDLVYSCKYCDEITFTVDTQTIYLDGSSHSGMSGASLKDKYTTESGTDNPLVATDANGNQYYQMIKLNDTTGRNSSTEQSQIWLPYHCDQTTNPNKTGHFTDLKEGAVGVLSFDINYGMNQHLDIYLCEARYDGNWGTPEGRINYTVINISDVKEKTVGDTTVKYVDVTGWNNAVLASFELKEDDILTAYGATGWFNVSVGLAIANDYVTAHYYINGDYVTSQAVELTTRNNSITTAYINAYTQAKDSGYLLDNLAFGYTKDATWVFDACDHANKTGNKTAPGCETQGYTTYTCPDCKLVWKDDYEDATNHNYVTVPAQASTCTVQGWNEFTYCSNCQTEDAVKAENLLGLADHTPGEAVKENIVNETCIAKGSYDSVVYCSVCKTHEISRTKVEVDEVDGHLNLVTVEGYDSTCYATGYTDGEKCEACGVTTVQQEVIEKKAHTLVEYGAVPSNEPCKTPSILAGKKCSVEGCDHIEYEPSEAPLVGHTEVDIPAQPSTSCLETGLSAGKECSVCGTVTVAPTETAPAAHVYDEEFGGVVSAEPCKTATILPGIRCSVCHEAVKTEPTAAPLVAHTVVEFGAVTSEKPCETAHTLPGTMCSVCNTVFTEPKADALAAHEYGDDRICDVCGYETACEHTVLNTLPAVAATCYSTGLTEGKQCADCGEITVAQTKTEMIAHTLVEYGAVESTQPCKTPSVIAGMKCSVEGCGHIEYAPTNAELVAHTEVEIPAVASTCIVAGTTAGTKCSVCDEVLVAPEAAPLAAHTESVLAAVEATCTKTGLTEGKECSVCNAVLVAQQTTEMIPHLNDITLDAVPATCTETGLTEGTKCSACGNTTKAQEVTNSLGHKNDVVLERVEPTCTETGLTAGVQCSRCQVATTPQEEIAELGHNFSAATCYSPEICQREGCGVEGAPAIANHTIRVAYVDSVLTYTCATCSDKFVAENSLYYGGDNTTNSYAKNGDIALSIVDGAYVVGGGTERSQYMLYIPSNNESTTFKGFNAENNAFGIISFNLKTDVTEEFRFIIMESRYRNGTQIWAGRGWDDNSMDILGVAPVKTDDVITGYNITGRSFTNGAIASVSVDENGMSEDINVQMAIKLTSDMQFMISYYVNGAFCGVYTRDLLHVNDGLDPDNTEDKKLMQQILDEGLLEAIYMCGYTAAGTGFTLSELSVGYTANADWMFDACDHVYGDVTTYDPDCDEKGYDESTCTLCGYVKRDNYVDALGHTGGVATCTSVGVCTRCEEAYIPALGHTLAQRYENSTMTYYCTADACNAEFDIETEGLYYDGSTDSVLLNGSNYVGGESKYNNGVNKVVSNGEYFEWITDIDATVNTESQLQMWIAHQKGNAANFTQFTRENASVGFLSFRVNANLKHESDAFSLKLVDDAWTTGEINVQLFALTPVLSNGSTVSYNIRGWTSNNADSSTEIIKTISATEWTGWIDVKIALVMDKENDTVIAHYYLDGEYVTSGVKDLTPANDKLSCVYFNLNAWVKGTGIYLDDVAFGHTINGHFTLDGQEHVVTPATACNKPETCSCGWVGEGTGHNLTEATCTAPATCIDCGATVGSTLPHNYEGATCLAGGTCTVCGAEGEKVFHDFSVLSYDKDTLDTVYYCSYGCNTGCTLTGFYNDGTNKNNFTDTKTAQYTATANVGDGYYTLLQYDTSATQFELWIPAATHTAAMADFSCANNAVGFLSFKINAYTTGDFAFQAVSHRGVDGEWDWSNSNNLFGIKGISNGATTATLTGLSNPNGQNAQTLTTVNLTDGWTGWLDVKIAIQLTSDGALNAMYYINGEYVGAQTVTMHAKQCFTAIYMSGNSQKIDSGIMLDDFVFGYTTHNILDGNVHTSTPATCETAETCSCGFVGKMGAHNWTGTATCTSGITCSKCGAEGERAAHTVSATLADSVATYSCSTCERTFVPEVLVSGDGSSTSNMAAEAKSPNIDLTTATADDNSYYSVLNTTGTAAQSWVWLNGMGNDVLNRLPEFSAANNSSGVLSFRLNLQGDSTTQLDVRPSYGRGSSQWKDYDGNNDAWNDCTFYLMQFNKAAGSTRTITSPYGTVGTINMNEWVEFTVKIQLHDDGTMDLDYYINGVLVKSVVGTAMPKAYAFSGVMFQLSSTTANTGYLLDDFVLGYSNNDHWTLDGNDHEIVSDKATCDSGIMCSCGQAIGAKLGHIISTTPTYNAATNTLVYSCEREGCTNKCEMQGYYNDGTSVDFYYGDNYTDGYAVTLDTSNGYIDLSQKADYNGTTNYHPQIWIPGYYDAGVKMVEGFTCANNATGILSFRIKFSDAMEDGKALSVIFGDTRGGSNWKDSDGDSDAWDDCVMQAMILTKSGSNVVINGYCGSNSGTNGSTLATVPANDWIEVVLQIQLSTKDGANQISYDAYINGAYCGTKASAYNVVTGHLYAVAFRTTTADTSNRDYWFDDFSLSYNANGHYTFDGEEHNMLVAEATCASGLKCSCGWETEPLAHANLEPSYTDGVKYSCADCNTVYTNSNMKLWNGSAEDPTIYNANSNYAVEVNESGEYQMLNTTNTRVQGAIWTDQFENKSDGTFDNFTCANNATGFLSFKMSTYIDEANGVTIALAEYRNNNANGWANASTWVDWTNSSLNIFTITGVTSADQTTVNVKGGLGAGTVLTTINVGEDKWTEWVDVVIKIDLKDNNTITLTYYINDELCGSYTGAMNISTYSIKTLYTSFYTTTTDSGIKFDDLAFGYYVPEA